MTETEKHIPSSFERDVSSTILRDLGPYSTRNSSKGALIVEAGKLIESIGLGLSVDKIRSEAMDGSLFSQSTRYTRERIWKILHYRYLSMQTEWMISDFKVAYEEGPSSRDFVSLLYLHFALRDRLTYDFVTQTLWDKWISNQRSVSPSDVLFTLDQASKTQFRIREWAEATRKKLASSILAALRDFGILEGKLKKALIRPVLPLFTAEHILRILTMEGVRGSDVLRDTTWRLFLYREEDVADILSRLAQNHHIQFERVGDTVVLGTPDEWRSA